MALIIARGPRRRRRRRQTVTLHSRRHVRRERRRLHLGPRARNLRRVRDSGYDECEPTRVGTRVVARASSSVTDATVVVAPRRRRAKEALKLGLDPAERSGLKLLALMTTNTLGAHR